MALVADVERFFLMLMKGGAVPRDKWRALYGALSEDLGDAAKQAGPEAFDSW